MNANVFKWALYDFANSLVLIVFLFYFPQWFVIERGNPAWWFNATLIASSILFLLSALKVATKIDRTGKKLSGLRFWSVLTIVLFGLVSLNAIFFPAFDLPAVVLFTLSMYSYLMCFLYYSPMLNDLSTEKNRARISGFAQSFNFGGQVFGLLVTLPIVAGTINFFGASGRAEALLPSAILMAVFAAPMLLSYRDKTDVAVTSADSKELLRSVLSNKPLVFLLLAFFFFGDALITFSSNFTLYLEEVFAATDAIKAMIGIGILALAGIGSVLSGYVADHVGLKKTLFFVLALWAVLFAAAPFVHSLAVVIPLFLFGGIIFGPVWTITRAMVGQLLVSGATASSYGYYVIIERFSTFVGPVTWGGVLLFGGESAQAYQLAIFSMGILVLIGLFFLAKVQEAPTVREA